MPFPSDKRMSEVIIEDTSFQRVKESRHEVSPYSQKCVIGNPAWLGPGKEAICFKGSARTISANMRILVDEF